MSLKPGGRLGPYEILAPLGAGGMGEVYRARDARLGREVAVKVLPESFAQDVERLARFEREAKVLGSLNHPHIAAIYGLEEAGGARALVMELVEGPTLAERIAEGPLPLDEVLPIARQIAEALEAAHEKGVVHRDLKPANVKLGPDGRVKVLDFGLAKAFDPVTSGQLVDSPTITAMATQHGVILGTAAYMSPEQARGQAVDKRSDIWAFGCVLYEMLTGKRVFEGDTASDTLAAILRGEVDWNALPARTPVALRKLLAHCLEKDRRKRLHDIGDASFELDESMAGASASALPGGPAARAAGSPRWRTALPWTLAALSAAAAVWLAVARPVASPTAAAQPGRLEIAGISVTPSSGIAISPDGREILAYDDYPGRPRLLRRSLESFEIQPIAGTEGSFNPFFSPDGREVAFFLFTRQLCVVPLAGGTRRCLAPAEGFSTGHWGAYGTIVYSHIPTGTGAQAGLRRVAAVGGEATWLTEVNRDRGEQAHVYPQLLPDGRHVLFTILRSGQDALAVVPIDGGEPRVVLEGALRGRYLRSGHLVYVQDAQGAVRATGFDLERLAPRGAGVEVVADIIQTADAVPAFEISESGTLAYSVGGQFAGQFNVGAVDRSGRVRQLFEESASWAQPRVSPDGTSILLRRAQSPDCHLWLFDVTRKSLSRVTLEGDSHDPHWAEGGSRIVFSVQRGGLRQIFSQPADAGAAAQLADTPFPALATAVSSDGRYVALGNDDRRGRNDIWIHDRESGATTAWLETAFDEDLAEFSPDGRWLAYTSDETGRAEVYVRPFPGPGQKFPISTQGGTGALWSRDGRELFYAEGIRLMRVAVATTPRFHAGEPEALFSNADFVWERPRNYDVTPDGNTFIMITRQPGTGIRSLRLVVDWVAELERLVPGGGP